MKISSTVHDGSKKVSGDAAGRVSDFAMSQFVHMDFENSATSAGKSGPLNSTYHVTQLQWHLSQVNSAGMSNLL